MPMWPVDDLPIDETARQLTEGEPRAGFKARVLARIAEGQRPASSRAWVLVPASAAALLVLAVVMWRQEPAEIRLTPDSRGDVRLKADTTTPAPANASDASAVPDRSREGAGGRAEARQVVRRAEAERPVLQEEDVAVLALPPSELAVDDIDVEPMEIRVADLDTLPVNPALVVDDIAIAPLDAVSAAQ
jgi:hypothetical protein